MASVCRTSCILLACAALGAVEMEVADFRGAVGIGPMPDEKSGVITTGSGLVGTPVEESYQAAPGGAFALTVAYGHLAPIGIIFGGEYRYVNGTQKFEGETAGGSPIVPTGGVSEFNYTSNGLAVNVGVGAAFSETWHAELVGIAGLERVSSDSPASVSTPDAITRQEGGGRGRTYGVRLGVFRTGESHWQLGLLAEWTKTVSSVENSYSDVTISYDRLEAVGFGAKASVGYRF